ncbi:uncharacterized protein LOC120653396 [Panicum virgatum]|uniref:uncharacterized protein LOC120653396 n=1 Tax=Panicum virgatum TaxID=38727 RepID=UPI0019D5E565|nr:uncharacterized protein LOC120653396 [Panicum virgatum]
MADASPVAFVDVWFLSQLYLKLGPGFNSILVSPLLGPTLDCVAVVGQTLYRELHESIIPEHFKQLAWDRQFATFCLNHYNSSHLDKYEPAPGKVTTHYFFYNGTCWCHGNFVARQKRSGWLSFLQPAPRTLFFFEISGSGYPREKVVTCTPLDEPVTEAYSVLGFPLGRSKRRSGKSDTICRTCNQHFYLPHPEHDNTRKVCEICLYHCEMCDNRPIVLHPGHVNLLSES